MAGIVSLYGLRGWTEQDDEPVKRELDRADFQVIQREPPVVSDSPSSDHDRPADTRSWPVRLRGSLQHPNRNPVVANRRRTISEREPRPDLQRMFADSDFEPEVPGGAKIPSRQPT